MSASSRRSHATYTTPLVMLADLQLQNDERLLTFAKASARLQLVLPRTRGGMHSRNSLVTQSVIVRVIVRDIVALQPKFSESYLCCFFMLLCCF